MRDLYVKAPGPADVSINTNQVNDTIISGGSKNYNLLDQNGDPINVDSVTGDDVTLDIISGSTGSIGKKILKTGQTISYRTGDDGDIEAGRAVDFFTLASTPINNDGSPTANTTTNRFTTINGSPGTPGVVEWIIDWSTFDGSTVLGYVNVFWGLGSSFTWDQAIDFCNSYSLNGFSNCRLANVKEIMNLIWYGGQGLNYAPFNTTNIDTWTSTTLFISTSFAHNTIFGDGRILYTSKTDTKRACPVRTFNVVGNTLT